MQLTFLFDSEMAVWVRKDAGAILFDTDSDPAKLASHAHQLGFSLDDVNAVFLSHGHDDHAGGLQAVLDANSDVPIYCAPGLLIPPYAMLPDRPPAFIGAPLLHGGGPRPGGLVTFTGTREVLPGCLGVNGAVGPAETVFRQKRGKKFAVHRFEDESWLVLGKPGARSMLVGCSHPGIAAMLRVCRDRYGLTDIHTLIGGLHTPDRTEEEMLELVGTLAELGIRRTYIGHCSGPVAQKAFRDTFGKSATDMAMGLRLDL